MVDQKIPQIIQMNIPPASGLPPFSPPFNNLNALSSPTSNQLLAAPSMPLDWNATARPWPNNLCIHQLFEDQVVKTPNAIAVECAGATLTYDELNGRANQLAHHLRHIGVGINSRVGISVERSLEMVIGVYGTLKAGGTYVPLDPAYPKDRLSYMVETAQCQVLLTQQKLAGLFGNLRSAQLIKLDEDWPTLATQSGLNPDPIATPESLIYIIFTSGSTGQPKAAAVYHKGFTNLLHWFVTDFEITSTDRTLLVSSLSFDLTQKNLYASLIRGGTLHLYPPGPYDVTLLASLIDRHKITLLNCTPSAFYPIVESNETAGNGMLASLRVVFLGGEPISINRLRAWITSANCRADIANTYGPTECTDICGAYRMTRTNMDDYSFVPLGRPIYNVQLAVVSPDLHLCPPGTAGELLVGGAGVGAGYINDAAMTADKFISNPFPEISGEKLYRTGDQVRWLESGVIEFLGRLDSQVKIRGFRIELNEIEAALDTHPGVREAVVVVNRTEGADTSSRLVCFFTMRGTQLPSPAALKDYLKSRLPEYMIPSGFHQLDAFPLSPNGKVDRKAISSLPEPAPVTALSPIASPLTGSPPLPLSTATTALEHQVHEIWTQVLGYRVAGLDENFFDVGGNSIQVAEIHARLQLLLKRELPITDLFVHTTIRTLVAHLSPRSTAITAQNAVLDRARRQREALAARKAGRS